MYLVDRIIPALQSYLISPALHANATSQSQLQGGIFVDLNPDKLNEVKDLLNTMMIQCKNNIALANDIKSLFSLMKEFSINAYSFCNAPH
jgi:hypothetical protein